MTDTQQKTEAQLLAEQQATEAAEAEKAREEAARQEEKDAKAAESGKVVEKNVREDAGGANEDLRESQTTSSKGSVLDNVDAKDIQTAFQE